MKRYLIGLSVLVAAGLGCGEEFGPQTPITVTLTPSPPWPTTVTVGDTLQLVAEARDASGQPIDASRFGVQWFSIDSTVLRFTHVDSTVLAGGAVVADLVAQSAGSSLVYIALTGLLTDSIPEAFATIVVEPMAVTAVGWPDTLYVGESDTLEITIADQGGVHTRFMDVSWESLDPARVSVDTVTTGTPSDRQRRVIITARQRSPDAPVTIRATVGGDGLEPVAQESSIQVMERWRSIMAGVGHTCGTVADSTLYCWGGGRGTGRIGTTTRPVPIDFGRDEKVVLLSAATHGEVDPNFEGSAVATCAATARGIAYCWGDAVRGSLGMGDHLHRYLPTEVLIQHGAPVISIMKATWNTCAVVGQGPSRTVCWGMGDSGVLGIDTSRVSMLPGCPNESRTNTNNVSCSTRPVLTDSTIGFRTVSGGQTNVCALSYGGDAYCWGKADVGGTANPNPGMCPDSGLASPQPCTATPRQVDLRGRQAAAVEAGGSHGCALINDGTVYCWGWNNGLQLGTNCGFNAVCRTPVAVTGAAGFVSISSGLDHNCGIRADSTAACWGANGWGQLGDNSINWSGAPVEVSGGLKWESINAGFRRTCGVTVRGAAYCWGRNHFQGVGLAGNANDFSSVAIRPVRTDDPASN